LKQIALLQKHLDSEVSRLEMSATCSGKLTEWNWQSYPMRNSILEVIGLLIKELSTSDDGDAEQQKRQLEAFFDLLFERFLDLNSYVRSKVATVLLKTCEYVQHFMTIKATMDLTQTTNETVYPRNFPNYELD
jgi:condensin complex subunit 1